MTSLMSLERKQHSKRSPIFTRINTFFLDCVLFDEICTCSSWQIGPFPRGPHSSTCSKWLETNPWVCVTALVLPLVQCLPISVEWNARQSAGPVVIRLGGSVDQDLKIVRIWERGDDDRTISWIWGKALRSLSVRDFHLLLTSLDFYLCEAPFLLRAATQLGGSIYAHPDEIS